MPEENTEEEQEDLTVTLDTEPTIVTLPDTWDMSKLTIYVFVLSADKRNASLSKCMVPI